MQLLGRALEQSSAACGEQRVAAEQQIVAKIRDMSRGVPRHLEYFEIGETGAGTGDVAVGDGDVDARDVFAGRSEHAGAMTGLEHHGAADVIAVVMGEQDCNEAGPGLRQPGLHRCGIAGIDHDGIRAAVQRPDIVVAKGAQRNDIHGGHVNAEASAARATMRRGEACCGVVATVGVRSESQLRADAAVLRPLLANLAGPIAVQIGAPAHLCLDPGRFGAVVAIDRRDAAAGVHARAEALPLPSASADVVLLMHVLDGPAEPAQVIREAARVLRGEGQLLVIGLRPFSPAGFAAWMRSLGAGMRPGAGWGLRMLMGANGLEWRGRRHLGALYVAKGVRRISSMTPLRPRWTGAARRRRGAVGVPGAGHAG